MKNKKEITKNISSQLKEQLEQGEENLERFLSDKITEIKNDYSDSNQSSCEDLLSLLNVQFFKSDEKKKYFFRVAIPTFATLEDDKKYCDFFSSNRWFCDKYINFLYTLNNNDEADFDNFIITIKRLLNYGRKSGRKAFSYIAKGVVNYNHKDYLESSYPIKEKLFDVLQSEGNQLFYFLHPVLCSRIGRQVRTRK